MKRISLYNGACAPVVNTRIQVAPQKADSSTGTGGHYIVTVFNNDVNTYDEVINILQRATACTLQEAAIEAWEIDHLGKSVVHHGSEAECNRAASIIRTIGIRTEVTAE